MAKRKKGDKLKRFMRDAGPALAHATVEAHARGESPFEAMLTTFRRQAFASIAEDAWEWVKEKQGRRVVLEWEGDGVHLRRFEPDGSLERTGPIHMEPLDVEKLRSGR
jgi:hypothetical protein